MALLVALLHAVGLFVAFSAIARLQDPAGLGLFFVSLLAFVATLPVQLVAWFTGATWAALAANLVGAVAAFLWLRHGAVGQADSAPLGALLFAAIGLPLSVALLAWKRWTRRRHG